MTDVTIDFRGEACTLNSRGALFLADHNTLVVSDLHFEKGTSYQRQGLTLPPYDTRTTLRNMAQVLKTYQPRRVIALGDSFHDQAARERLDESEVDTIRKLTQAHD